MTTQINIDQQLGLIIAPGSPAVATDQMLSLLIERRLVPKIIFNYLDQMVALLVERRNPRTQITGGNFEDPSGNPITGYLEIRLSTDAMSPQGQVSAGITATVPLVAGNISGFAALWATSLLDAAGGQPIFYAMTAYTANGQKVWGSWQLQIPAVPVYDISGLPA